MALLCLVDAGCREGPAETVLVILGNEPLDPATPTIDMIARVDRAVEFYKADSNTVLVMSGGATVGEVSEARMMADMATAKGVPTNAIFLEERSMRTDQNARFSAEMVRGLHANRVMIVSKKDHLEWAMPEFRKYPVFRRCEALACDVDREAIISQMTAYLKDHPGNTRVQARLDSVKKGNHGAD